MTHTPGPDYDAADWKRVQERRAKEARLIAAAPELLTALKEMMREFDRELDPHEEHPDWLVLARAAIAKAEGEGK